MECKIISRDKNCTCKGADIHALKFTTDGTQTVKICTVIINGRTEDIQFPHLEISDDGGNSWKTVGSSVETFQMPSGEVVTGRCSSEISFNSDYPIMLRGKNCSGSEPTGHVFTSFMKFGNDISNVECYGDMAWLIDYDEECTETVTCHHFFNFMY